MVDGLLFLSLPLLIIQNMTIAATSAPPAYLSFAVAPFLPQMASPAHLSIMIYCKILRRRLAVKITDTNTHSKG